MPLFAYHYFDAPYLILLWERCASAIELCAIDTYSVEAHFNPISHWKIFNSLMTIVRYYLEKTHFQGIILFLHGEE